MRRIELTLGLVAAALLTAAPAHGCTVSLSGVSFGAYDGRDAAPDDSSGTITALCPPNIRAPVIAIEAGQSGSFFPRTLRSGGSTLSYNLFTSLARTTVWGNGAGGTATVTLTGGTVNAGTRQLTRTIYGRIPPLQNVPAGTYSDTLMVTITF
jgi:spore coat protein U-like protein